jgi:hypothetical protein
LAANALEFELAIGLRVRGFLSPKLTAAWFTNSDFRDCGSTSSEHAEAPVLAQLSPSRLSC